MTADPTPSGDPRVDAALARLGELDGLDLPGQAAVFDEIYQKLHEILTDLEPSTGDVSAPGVPGAPGGPGSPGSADGSFPAGGWT